MEPSTQSWASSARARKVMQGNRSRDTLPELAIRSAVHRLGLRYRVSAYPLPGLRRSADLVFSSARVAVFVDGCYWHGCPDHYVPSRSHKEYWANKVSRNRERDADTNQQLLANGWLPLRVWAHEDPVQAADHIAKAVRERLGSMPNKELSGNRNVSQLGEIQLLSTRLSFGSLSGSMP